MRVFECYDVKSNKWEELPSALFSCAEPTLSVFQDTYLYKFGGIF